MSKMPNCRSRDRNVFLFATDMQISYAVTVSPVKKTERPSGKASPACFVDLKYLICPTI